LGDGNFLVNNREEKNEKKVCKYHLSGQSPGLSRNEWSLAGPVTKYFNRTFLEKLSSCQALENNLADLEMKILLCRNDFFDMEKESS